MSCTHCVQKQKGINRRTCVRCNIHRPIEDFSITNGKYNDHCNECLIYARNYKRTVQKLNNMKRRKSALTEKNLNRLPEAHRNIYEGDTFSEYSVNSSALSYATVMSRINDLEAELEMYKTRCTCCLD